MNTNSSQTAAYIWSLADLLRGDFKQSQYGRVILPFTLLRRLECVLEDTKPQVLSQADKLKSMSGLEAEAREKFLLKAAKQSFYNTSAMDLSKLGSADVKSNLLSYVDSFSVDAREIFEHFKFSEFVAQLDEANLLYKVVQKIALTDLSPAAISNHDMGLVFEELIRRFAESSNETAGEHFTPRDIVRLTTSLVFMEDNDALTEPGVIRTIYDPTAGTGGFLSSGMEYVHELNPEAVMRAFGQELNPESYAICKGDMLIKGQDVSSIKLGNTLSDDHLYDQKFDYMLSNPPFGVDWKKVEGKIKDEHKLKGFDGRFGPGLPRVSDGSLLFLMHLIAKIRDYDVKDTSASSAQNGGRIGIILNGSPLFTGGAGSGESEIRRYILESDLLEAIVALPTDMFYNTGIATYVWVLSNKKSAERQGKVQLINGVHLYQKMRKSLGSKRQEIGEDDIALITRTYGNFEVVESYPLDKTPDEKSNRGRQSAINKKTENKTFSSKILESHEFGYRRITIERPLRQSVHFTDDRVAKLRFANGPLNAVMQRIYELHGQGWATDSTGDSYGKFAEIDNEVRALIKADFTELKEKQVEELLAPKLWDEQKALLDKAIQLQAEVGAEQFDDFNAFDNKLKAALKTTGIKLDVKEKRQLIDAITWTNPNAEPVVKKVLKPKDPAYSLGSMYGVFEHQGKVVQFQPDDSLRDNEEVPLTAETARGTKVNAVNEAYFNKEVAPQVADAWIDAGKCDEQDEQIGVVGYEIPFNRLISDFLRDRVDQELTKLKSLLSIDSQGKYVWHFGKPRFSLAKKDSTGNRFSINESRLTPEYLALFLESSEGEEWLGYAGVDSLGRIPISRLLASRIDLPNMRTQEQIVRISKEHDALLSSIDSIRPSILSAPGTAEQQLRKYQDANNRFEADFARVLPHPLSVLWVQAESTLDDKNWCENFVKFYEYLGLFTMSVILGQLDESDVQSVLQKGREKPDKPNVTMGTAYNVIRKVREKYCNKIHPQLHLFISKDWEDVLHRATMERNDIAHRGLHTKAKAHQCKNRIHRLNEEFGEISRDLFEQLWLVAPKSAKYLESEGQARMFLYDVDLLCGLALNPAITRRVKVSEAMVDRELYITWNTNEDTQTPLRLFPFMKLLDTDDENGISAFYFYNQWDKEHKEFLFVCPYPTAVQEKRLPDSTLFPLRTL